MSPEVPIDLDALGNRYGSYSKLSVVIFGPWDPYAEPILPCQSGSDQNRWVSDYKAFTGKNQTFAERKLWTQLRFLKTSGFHFRPPLCSRSNCVLPAWSTVRLLG